MVGRGEGHDLLRFGVESFAKDTTSLLYLVSPGFWFCLWYNTANYHHTTRGNTVLFHRACFKAAKYLGRSFLRPMHAS